MKCAVIFYSAGTRADSQQDTVCVARNAIDFYLFFLPFSVTGYAIFFVHPDGESDFSRFSFSFFFFVWKRWGKDEERKGRSVMILALLSYRGGGGVANWIRRYIRASKSKRGFLSRGLLLKRRRIFKFISNKWKIRNREGRGPGYTYSFHRVPSNFYYSDNSSVSDPHCVGSVDFLSH